MRINHNIASLNTYRQLSTNTASGSKSIEKLSSGLRINRAGDDAAGLAISEKMRGQIRGLDQAQRNAQDGISMIQTAEGGLNEVHSILQRMRELSVQSSNDTNNDKDRQAIGDELVELKSEIDRISTTTKFNGKGLLDGSFTTTLAGGSELKVGSELTGTGASISKIDVSKALATTTYTMTTGGADGSVTMSATINGQNVSQTVALAANSQTVNFSTFGVSFEVAGTATAGEIATQLIAAANDTITTAGNGSANFLIGANGAASETINVSFDKMDSTTMGSGAGNQISDKIADNTAVDTKAKADALITVLDDAIVDVSTQRSKLGATQNRLEHTINNLGTSSENLTAAESRIRDADMAKEMMEFTKNNILSQAAQSMLAQANQQPQGVLQLLR